jgi:hypothetical protein
MNFIIINQEKFQTNWSVHNINTSNKHHLHGQNSDVSCSHKSTFYAGVKTFNTLPPSLKIRKNEKCKIQSSLKKMLKYTLLLLCRLIFYM